MRRSTGKGLQHDGDLVLDILLLLLRARERGRGRGRGRGEGNHGDGDGDGEEKYSPSHRQTDRQTRREEERRFCLLPFPGFREPEQINVQRE